MSRLLKGAEHHYPITHKECLAVLWAIKYFRTYLYGTKFDVVTDHQALNWLMTIKDPNGRLARWSLYLQSYEFNILHRSGKKHNNADTLSRPVLLAITLAEESTENIDSNEDENISSKYLDIYEDEYALYYLKYGRHKSGSSNSQIKRIKNLAKHYKMENNTVYYTKDPKTEKYVIVPKIEERDEIITKAHLLGHFQDKSTIQRIQEKYFWKKMS